MVYPNRNICLSIGWNKNTHHSFCGLEDVSHKFFVLEYGLPGRGNFNEFKLHEKEEITTNTKRNNTATGDTMLIR